MLEFDRLMPIAFATSRLAADWDLPSGPGSFKGWMATQKDIGSNDLELLLYSDPRCICPHQEMIVFEPTQFKHPTK